MPPLLLFQKEKEYLQSLPNQKVIKSYLSHDRQIKVQTDSMINYKNSKYSVPPAYIGKNVYVRQTFDKLHIYYNTEEIAVHKISSKKLNYNKEHYIELLSNVISNKDDVSEMAETNLKQMDNFDFSFQPGINKKELLEFTSLGFIERNENILFVGTSGVGKTHLATAIGVECARNRYSTYFVSFENLMTQLKKALNGNRLEQRMKFFSRYKILIIDELGYMPIDSNSANLFFQLIARRYEKHCTIVTTNMPFSKWGEIFGSTTLANAVLDRLLHHSSVISIKGPSYRLKEKRRFLEG